MWTIQPRVVVQTELRRMCEQVVHQAAAGPEVSEGTPAVRGGIQPGCKTSAVNCSQDRLETESELSLRTNILKML